MDAPAARRSASGRAQLLNGLRRPSQIKQQEFIQQATIEQLARLQAQTEEIFAQMHLDPTKGNHRENASNNMQNSIRNRRMSSNPPSISHLRAPNNSASFKGRRPASLNLSALNTSTPIHEDKEIQLPQSATHNRNNNKKKTYSNLGLLPPVPQSAPANGRNTSFRVPSAMNSAGATPQGCVRQPRGPPSENLEGTNFSSRQRKLASRRLSGLANIAEARRRVSIAPSDEPIHASNDD
ncbi:hypothetical protein E3Q08_03313 [Wallemia mellicola]|uniref:Shugoshin C-terminal domain-containing protein n=1 Tax=Wallemia mellicola TaxID=1708541 RepID=A0AB38MR42_9BASI|nr:hypothetical protein E3Q16_04284 [Wallemia mellicola]TIC41382.1 hypothetical protein E3Q08_03313 [Wallemia mellicola]TIC62589.1 hypothetical protein E3Q02_03420 [Wallemia mellicola]